MVAAASMMRIEQLPEPQPHPRVRTTEPRQRLVVGPQMSVDRPDGHLNGNIRHHESNVPRDPETELCTEARTARQHVVGRTTRPVSTSKRPEGLRNSDATEIVHQRGRTGPLISSSPKSLRNDFRSTGASARGGIARPTSPAAPRIRRGCPGALAPTASAADDRGAAALRAGLRSREVSFVEPTL